MWRLNNQSREAEDLWKVMKDKQELRKNIKSSSNSKSLTTRICFLRIIKPNNVGFSGNNTLANCRSSSGYSLLVSDLKRADAGDAVVSKTSSQASKLR